MFPPYNVSAISSEQSINSFNVLTNDGVISWLKITVFDESSTEFLIEALALFFLEL
jgi:hypothetical protein